MRRLCLPGLVLPMLLSACAHTYIDADGNRNVVGWVHLTLPPAMADRKAADWIRMRTFGLAVSSTDIGGAFELGYSDNTLAVIRNNSCVALDRLPPSLQLSQGEQHAPHPSAR